MWKTTLISYIVNSGLTTQCAVCLYIINLINRTNSFQFVEYLCNLWLHYCKLSWTYRKVLAIPVSSSSFFGVLVMEILSWCLPVGHDSLLCDSRCESRKSPNSQLDELWLRSIIGGVVITTDSRLIDFSSGAECLCVDGSSDGCGLPLHVRSPVESGRTLGISCSWLPFAPFPSASLHSVSLLFPLEASICR